MIIPRMPPPIFSALGTLAGAWSSAIKSCKQMEVFTRWRTTPKDTRCYVPWREGSRARVERDEVGVWSILMASQLLTVTADRWILSRKGVPAPCKTHVAWAN